MPYTRIYNIHTYVYTNVVESLANLHEGASRVLPGGNHRVVILQGPKEMATTFKWLVKGSM